MFGKISTLYLWISFLYWIHSYTTIADKRLCGLWLLILIWEATMIQDLVILDELLKNGYDRRATPTNHYNSTSPTTASVSIIVSSMSSPSPMSMDYKTDLYLRQKWKDERLKHENLKQPLDLSDPNLVKSIWKPEIYFPNAKEADFHFVTVPNVLVRIHPDGEILYMLRLRLTFSCMMDLSKFPLDRQKCTMEVASFSKTVEELLLEWVPHKPVETQPLKLTLFELDKIETRGCPESSGQIGNYSCLVAEFHLSRSLGFHLVQSYLPTILMVAISWVSFWMDVNSVPGRVTLGITTLLTVSSVSTNIQDSLPPSSYVKAIDVWLGTCTAFVFLALLEFTFVNYLFRKVELQEREFYLEEEAKTFHITRARHYCPYHHLHDGGSSYCENKKCACHWPNQGYERTSSVCNRMLQARNRENGKVSNHLEQPKFVESSSQSQNSRLCDEGPYPPIPVESEQIPNQNVSPSKNSLAQSTSNSNRKQWFPDPQTQARSIDETCRYAFPVAFALFNCIYWPYYLLT